MTKEKYDSIGAFIRGNAFALSLQVISVVVLLANLWLATKLAPLAQNIDTVASRVDAVEEYNTENKPLVERFIKLETNYTTLTGSITRIESKLDRLIEREYEQ